MVDAKPWVAPVDNGDQAESRFAGFCKMLGAVRINAMVESLQLSQQIRENVCCLFQRILDQRASLFFNRHIDQIILCCFYGVAQIYQLNLTFTKILNNYREQTQCEPQFFCVFVDWSSARCRGACEQRTGQEHVGIITFYNEIFFPSVESLLFELGRPGGATVKSDQIPEVSIKNDGHLAQCPGSPKTPPIPGQKKESATQSVDVSPIRSSEISRLKLTFRKIVYKYRKQPQCDPQVFLSVFVDWSLACKNGACKQRTGQEDVNIITFYNEIFIPSVKPLLFEL